MSNKRRMFSKILLLQEDEIVCRQYNNMCEDTFHVLVRSLLARTLCPCGLGGFEHAPAECKSVRAKCSLILIIGLRMCTQFKQVQLEST